MIEKEDRIESISLTENHENGLGIDFPTNKFVKLKRKIITIDYLKSIMNI